MSPKNQGRLILGTIFGGMGLLVLLALTGLAPTQAVARARLAVVARLDSPAARGVRLTFGLPRGYGLPESERDWPALNSKPNEAESVLGSEPVRVTLPRYSDYCTTYFPRVGLPPPPVRFVFRLSDAPGELYEVWRRNGSVAYAVLDSAGHELPKESATWRLNVGAFTAAGLYAPVERLWLLDVAFERQHQPPDRGSGQLRRGLL